jgi:hypothetical protein
MADCKRAIKIGLPFAGPAASASSFPNFTSFAMSNANYRTVFVFRAVKAMTITWLGVRLTNAFTTPPTYSLGLYAVDGSGVPTGGALASGTFAPVVGDNGTIKRVAMVAGYTCTAGELLAISMDYSSGTITGSAYESVAVTSNAGPAGMLFPYAMTYIATWTRRTAPPIFAYGSDTDAFGPAFANVSYTSFDSTTTPDEYGMKFTTPAGAMCLYKLREARVYLGKPEAANQTLTLKLYDTNGTTVLQTATQDSDVVTSVSVSGCYCLVFTFADASLASLVAGQAYRVGLTTDATASNVGLQTLTVTTANDLTAFDGGADYVLTTSTDAGAWTDSTTARPLIELVLEEISMPPQSSVQARGELVGPLWRGRFDWTAGADGGVSRLFRLVTAPGAGNVPTSYDVTLETVDGVDVLGGQGAGRSASAVEAENLARSPGDPRGLALPTSGLLRFKVANAGMGGSGSAVMYAGRRDVGEI